MWQKIRKIRVGANNYSPLLMIILTAAVSAWIFSGCGGAGSAGITALGPGSNITGGGTALTMSMLDKGWSLFRIGESSYTDAEYYFNQVIGGTFTDNDKASARAGLGWIELRRSGASAADKSNFESSLVLDPSNQEAKLGLALISLAGATGQAVNYLESIGLWNVNYSFSSSQISMSNAKAHALMALAYYQAGNLDSSEAQIDKARALDGNDLTIEQMDTSLTNLGI
ncbi:MAG: hypothetical protein PHQ23_06065 [Candidatus Wallbacteria bacterium]|nr:hypothetical protein [Candidatus Wallbacteria bacterium]